MDLSLEEIIKSNKIKKTELKQKKTKLNKTNEKGFRIKRKSELFSKKEINKNKMMKFLKPNDVMNGGNFKQPLPLKSEPEYKIQISNLHFKVSDEDIKELFNEFGAWTRAGINYDQYGHSRGTAEVIFKYRNSATLAQNKYNGVPLDGRPMVITVVCDQSSPKPLRRNTINDRKLTKVAKNNNAQKISKPQKTQKKQHERIVKSKKSVQSFEQLDAELDDFMKMKKF